MLPHAVSLEELRSIYDHEMHTTMLQDAPRHRFYATCLSNHHEDIAGKAVADIGAGFGVMAALAVRYGGAGDVHVVEAMPEVARAIPKVLDAVLSPNENRERRITVHAGLIQDICENPPSGWSTHVAALVSEWFGLMGLSEGIVLPFVQCRDHFYPRPQVIPGRLLVWIQAASGPPARGPRFQCGPVLANADNLVDKPHLLLDADLQHCTHQDLFESASQRLVVECDRNSTEHGERGSIPLSGLVGWFDLACCNNHMHTYLRTGPDAPSTHWPQTWMPFEEPVLAPAKFDVRLRVADDLDGLPKLVVDVEWVLEGNASQNTDSCRNARFLLESGRCLYDIDVDTKPRNKRHKAVDSHPRLAATPSVLDAETHVSPSDLTEICRLVKEAVDAGPN